MDKNMKIHKFEVAGLGKAPFMITGFFIAKYQACAGASIQPGATCDYCGTAILNVFVIKSSDGKTSHVGCDCVLKTDDKCLIAQYKTTPEYKKHQRELRAAKAKAVREQLALLIEAHMEDLKHINHPYGYKDRKTQEPLTMLDYAVWMKQNAGDSGRKGTLSFLKEQLKLS